MAYNEGGKAQGPELGQDAESGDEVILPHDERVLGAAVIGKPGTGKSSLLEHLILADLAEGTPGMVFDPHGSLVSRLISAASTEQAERIILLEVTPEAPFGLNLLALRKPVHKKDDVVTWAVDTVVETVKKLYSEDDVFAPRLERYLRLAARTLIPAGRTLVDIPSLFEDEGFRAWCLDKVATASEAQSLRSRWAGYERLRPVDRVLQTESLMNRIDGIIDSPLISAIVGSKKTTVPFDEILSGDSMLLVSLPSETLGRDRCDFIGAMLLCELANRVFSRTVAKTMPPRLHLYLDEYQRFATSTTADFLEEGRKYNVGVVVAHQTLYQITEQRIRNASRHAGTLVALGLTRPDAEQLAGEFPFEPREEWIEVIEDEDGLEPKYVFSPTPAEDIYLSGHSNEAVDKIARAFFAYSPRWTMDRVLAELRTKPQHADTVHFLGDPRKSAGVAPRPGIKPLNSQIQVTAYDVNDLLVDAMSGNLQTEEALIKKLMLTNIWAPLVELGLPEDGSKFPWTRARLGVADFSTIYYPLPNRSPAIREEEACDCADRIDDRATRGHERFTIGPLRPRRADDPLGLHLISCRARQLTEADRAFNEKLEQVYKNYSEGFLQGAVSKWLIHHLIDRKALRENRHTDDFQTYNDHLARSAWVNFWNGKWEWEGEVLLLPDGSPHVPSAERLEVLEAELPKRREEYSLMCYYATQRLRHLEYLCDALYREPVMVPSGEQQVRKRTRHIVHPAQTQQDALNEFAAELVNPPEQYVAHVRMPQRYHRIKLNDPVAGEVNAERIGAVRERSQEMYRISDDDSDNGGGAVSPSPSSLSGSSPGLRRISRRPRSHDPNQQALPYPIDPEG